MTQTSDYSIIAVQFRRRRRAELRTKAIAILTACAAGALVIALVVRW